MSSPTAYPDSGRFWKWADRLVATSEIVIDRPRGSRHPRYPVLIYPLDYGYLARTTAMDGDGVDVWRGSRPEQQVGGAIVTIDLFKRDAEIKLLLGCTPDETAVILEFLNDRSMAATLISRPESPESHDADASRARDIPLAGDENERSNKNDGAGRE